MLAGYLAYEAGLALEARLAPLAGARSGGNGPLVWLGLFDAPEIIPAADMPEWLASAGERNRQHRPARSADFRRGLLRRV